MPANEVIERLRDAQNAHDLDAFAACFDPGYRSEQPVHPDRAFVGRDQVRANWAEVFAGVPALAGAAVLVRSTHERSDGTGYPTACPGTRSPWDRGSSPSARPSRP